METMEDNNLISIKEIMKLLGICEGSARALIKSEGFPAIPIGASKLVVPRAAFMAWFTNPDMIAKYKEQQKNAN